MVQEILVEYGLRMNIEYSFYPKITGATEILLSQISSLVFPARALVRIVLWSVYEGILRNL
jgi:hypothetical protein